VHILHVLIWLAARLGNPQRNPQRHNLHLKGYRQP
jgi:hypothetical protein